jgi:ABC-type bacteriocin/lantibiotic exporter with double-glycine peptidase domain
VERLRVYIQFEKKDLWVVIVYSMAIGLLGLIVPVAVQSLVNTVQFGTILQPLILLAIFVLVALGFQSLLQALRTLVVETIQQRIFVRLAGDVAHRLVRVQVNAFDRVHGPELVNRFLEVVTVQKAASQLVIDGLELVMTTLLGMLLLAAYHPILLVFDVVLLLLIVAILWGLGNGATKTAVRESKMKYEIVAWLQEMARNLVTFKSGWGALYGLNQTDALVGGYLKYRVAHFRILMRQIIGFLVLQALGSSILLGAGGYLVIQQQLTLGQLIAAELVVTLIVGSLAKFGKQLETFYDLEAAVDKLGYLQDLPQERQGGEDLPRSSRGASVELQQVRMSLPGRPELFRDLTVEFPAGSRVGLFGSSGRGKSMLLDVLYGLRQPDHGITTLDNRHYRDLDLRALRAQVSLVRDTEVFMGTVADNVMLGNPNARLDDVREALESVHLLRDVMLLRDGLETELATGGLPLTPSQSVRLVLARAICAKPRLLILDEALDRLDDAEQVELLNVLFGPQQTWTVVVVSSSLTVLSRCEYVYTLQAGRLIESHQLAAPRGGVE